MPPLARGPLAAERPQAVSTHEGTGAPPLHQLPLFPGASGPRPEHEATYIAAVEPPAEAPGTATDDRQLDLFADRVVLFRELEAAIASGSFDEAHSLRAKIGESLGPEATRSLAPLDRLASLAWEGPPETPLAVWAEVDRQLADQPHLRDRVRGGAFARLLRSHGSERLLAARPDCLPALAHAVRSCLGRSPEEGRREARRLVRDSLLAGRALERSISGTTRPWPTSWPRASSRAGSPAWGASAGCGRAPRPAPRSGRPLPRSPEVLRERAIPR